MKRIGVTGSIATGKSSFCKFLKDKGYPVISADEHAKKALLPDSSCYSYLLKIFDSPPLPLTSEWLAHQIFSNPHIKTQVENIMHPFIFREIKKAEKKFLESKFIFYEIPLLFETHMEKYFDKIVLIYSPRNNQKKRLLQRISPSQAQKRIQSQMSQEEKLSKSNFIIHNDKTLKDLEHQAQTFLQTIEKTL